MNTMSYYLIAFAIIISVPFASAAHSRKRVVVSRQGPPRYDRSITTFDNTGRLLQVEYSREAAARGDPIIGVLTNQSIVLVGRLSKMHRIDDHIFMLTAGLSGDGNALAASLRSSCQQHRLSYGESPRIEEIADEAAALQHELTRTGGARPIGCTAILAGYDVDGKPSLFRLTPGAVSENCRYCTGGKGSDKLMKALTKYYDEIREKDTLEAASSLLDAIKDEANEETDLWTLERDSSRRGNIKTTCILNVNPRQGKQILESIDDKNL